MVKNAEKAAGTNDILVRIIRGTVFSLLFYMIASAVLAAFISAEKVSEGSMPQLAAAFIFFSVFFGSLIGVGAGKNKRPLAAIGTAAVIILIKLVISAFGSGENVLAGNCMTMIGCTAFSGILAALISAGKPRRVK